MTQIESTPKGLRVLKAGRARRVAKLASALSRLNGNELAEFGRGVQLLKAIVASIPSKLA